MSWLQPVGGTLTQYSVLQIWAFALHKHTDRHLAGSLPALMRLLSLRRPLLDLSLGLQQASWSAGGSGASPLKDPPDVKATQCDISISSFASQAVVLSPANKHTAQQVAIAPWH